MERRPEATTVAGRTLFEAEPLLAMCQLEHSITDAAAYKALCETKPGAAGVETDECCRPWSLPNYVALVANLDTCADLTERNVNAAKRLLLQCRPHFDAIGQLDCQSEPTKCKAVPTQCLRLHAVYDMVNYLADDAFVPNGVRAGER